MSIFSYDENSVIKFNRYGIAETTNEAYFDEDKAVAEESSAINVNVFKKLSEYEQMFEDAKISPPVFTPDDVGTRTVSNNTPYTYGSIEDALRYAVRHEITTYQREHQLSGLSAVIKAMEDIDVPQRVKDHIVQLLEADYADEATDQKRRIVLRRQHAKTEEG